MECSRGWTERCPNAKGPRCTCQCAGDHHGTAHGPSLTERRDRAFIAKVMADEEMRYDWGALGKAMRPSREEGDPDEVVYRGVVRGQLDVTIHRMPEDYELDRRLDLVNHSPTGFQWGYAGSGPAQSALAILADYLGNDERARVLYQEFKFVVIAGLAQDTPWTLTRRQMGDALRAIRWARAEAVAHA